MALSIKGDRVYESGKTVDRGANHSDAVNAAKDRAKGAGSSVALTATAQLVTTLDFDGAKPYVSVVDTTKATASDVAAVNDPEEVEALLERSDDEIAKEHRVEVLAKQPGYSFSVHGVHYSEDAWVVLHPDRQVAAFEPPDFTEHFTAKPRARKSEKKSAEPPPADKGSADELAGKTKGGK